MTQHLDNPNPTWADQPRPSAELVLYRVQLQALLVVLGPKKSKRLLIAMQQMLRQEADLSSVVPIRQPWAMKKNPAATRQALAWWDSALAALVSAAFPR